MQRLIFILVPVIGILGIVTGLPPGLSDPCVNSPCGKGAKCQTMTTIAVCTCPVESTGDPFVDCNLMTDQSNSSPKPVAISTSTLTHSISYEPMASTSGLPPPISSPHVQSISSSSFSHDFNIGTEYNRIPIRGSSQVPSSSFPSGTTSIRNEVVSQSNNLPRFPLLSHNANPQPTFYPPKQNNGPDLTLNSFTKDPMGQYSNCRTVNNFVVCADNSVDDASSVMTSQHAVKNDNRFQEQDLSQHFGSHQNDNRNNQYHHPTIHQNNGNTESKQVIQPQPHRGNMNGQEDGNDSLCKSMCGINSICRLFLGRPVCGCSEGQTGDPSVKCEPIVDESKAKSMCEKHVDCASTEICLESKCIDPCNKMSLVENKPPVININSHSVNRDMCGRNAKCLVIGHTPLCGCMDGFYGNPYVACVA